MRCALVVAVLAAAAACASAQSLQLAIVSGRSGSLAPPSIVGIFKGLTSQLEYDSLLNADPAFFQNFGFPRSVVNGSGVGDLTIDINGNLNFLVQNPTFGNLNVPGQFRLYVCNSKVKGQAQTVGTFAAAPRRGGGGRWLLQTAGAQTLSQSLLQVFKTQSSTYLATVLFDANGSPQSGTAFGGPGNGRFVLKLDVAASALDPATIQPRTATSLCGAKTLRIP